MDLTSDRRPVPWKTIWATIGSVLITVAAVGLLQELQRVITWLIVSAFFAVVLNPAVELLVSRARMRRGAATGLTFLVGLIVVTGMGYLFLAPLITETTAFAKDLPQYVADAREGRGPAGDLVRRFNLDERLVDQQTALQDNLDQLGTRSVQLLGTVGNAIFATVTVVVLTFLMLLEAPRLVGGLVALLPERRQARTTQVVNDCGKAITGYMAGNLLISLICGVLTYVFLLIADVPFKGVIAVFVAVTDLIPLIGATVGAVAATAVAFLHSPAAGIGAIVFFIVYQQLENQLLQPAIQARTVKLSPLVVLVSVLIGVELAGILGALVAIPVAGMIKVVVRDLWDNRRGQLKETPTIGQDETPIDEDAPPQLPAPAPAPVDVGD